MRKVEMIRKDHVLDFLRGISCSHPVLGSLMIQHFEQLPGVWVVDPESDNTGNGAMHYPQETETVENGRNPNEQT